MLLKGLLHLMENWTRMQRSTTHIPAGWVPWTNTADCCETVDWWGLRWTGGIIALLRKSNSDFFFFIRYCFRPTKQARVGLWAVNWNFWTRWLLRFPLTCSRVLLVSLPERPGASCSLCSSFQSSPIHGKAPNKLIHWRQLQPMRPMPWDTCIFTGLVLSQN